MSRELSIRAQVLEEGGPAMWQAFMDDLREAHLGIPCPRPDTPSVAATLQAAYEAVLAGAETSEEWPTR